MFSPSGVASMVAAIAGELEGIVPVVAGTVGVSPQVVSEIQAGIDGLKNTASALATADAGAASDLMDRVEADVNAVLASLATLPLPPQAAMIMRIVQIMVPMLEGVAAIIWPPQAAAAPAPAPAP